MIITHDEGQLLEIARHARVDYGAKVRKCGWWIWAKFDGKPAQEVIDQLKAEGWFWASKKKEWVFRGAISSCSKKKNMGWGYIIDHFGEEEIN